MSGFEVVILLALGVITFLLLRIMIILERNSDNYNNRWKK